MKNECLTPINQCFTSETILNQLIQAMNEPLPGMEAQLLMAPPSREILLRYPTKGQALRYASVLIPIFTMNDELHTLLITRNVYPGVHSGQVAFAGGKREPGDLSDEHTALREAEEEVGISPLDVNVLGCLTELYIPPSQFLVKPVLGYLQQPPRLRIDSTEVSTATFVSLNRLFAAETKKMPTIETSAGPFETPAYCLDGMVIWGATAMIISELEQIWKKLTVPYPFP